MPKRRPNKLFLAGRHRRAMFLAFAEMVAEPKSQDFHNLASEWARRHKRMPKGLRLADRNPALHEQIQQRHNSNPSETTLKREAESARRGRLRAKSKALKKAKADAAWIARAERSMKNA